MDVLRFLQTNGQWISAIFVALFAGVQVWLQNSQNRQQIRFYRLKLAQELNDICTHFPYDKDDCKKIMDWLMGHGASFTFLLNVTDMQKYWSLYEWIGDLQSYEKELYFEDMKKHEEFYSRVMDLETVLREASYGIPRHHKKKYKFFKRWFHAKH